MIKTSIDHKFLQERHKEQCCS